MGITVTEARILDNYDQLGIDTPTPGFAWILNADGRNENQTAYRIIVVSSDTNLEHEVGDVWDTGKMMSSCQYNIAFDGNQLKSSTKYWWKVKVWDGTGKESPWSSKAAFITGILRKSDWSSRWIQSRNDTASVPVLLRKEFHIAKAVKQATAHVCGLGQFEFHLNGLKVGDHEYDPGWTDYEKSCLYVTFDMTHRLTQGINSAGIMLGDGFFNCSSPKGRYSKHVDFFGMKRLLFQLDILYDDGTCDAVVSDLTWKTSTGPITYSHLYGGEDYDARLEKAGWDKAGYDDSNWDTAVCSMSPGGILTSQKHPPLKNMRVYETVQVTEPIPDEYIFDLGQSFSGFIEVTASGKEGQNIILLPSENLADNGDINQDSIGQPQWCSYTLKGAVEEIWRTRFYYTGFRYVKVKGGSRAEDEGKPNIMNVRGYHMYSSAEQAGSFSTSSAIYNAIHRMVVESCKSNLQSVMTDCPHREKLCWLEQTHLMAPSLAFNFDIQALWSKIARDTAESQLADGLVPCIAPEFTTFDIGFRDTCSWGSAAVIVPWYIYQIYGDLEILRRQYDTMRKYVEYLKSVALKDHLDFGLGDWGNIEEYNTSLVETAHYYHAAAILRDTAALLAYGEDAREYSILADQIKSSYNNEDYWDESDKCYVPKTQTHHAMPLYFKLVQEGSGQSVLNALLDNLKRNDYHVQTGEIGHRYLLQLLSENGLNDIVDKIITNPTQPSFRYLVDIGRTSMPEYWDGSCSQQHAMMGHVEEWFYNSVAGIQQTKPGYEEFRIKPAVIGELTSVRASVKTIRGKATSSWIRNGSTFEENVTVPVNSRASVYIPTFGKAAPIVKESDTILWENGSPTENVNGIHYKGEMNGYMIWEIGSGDYRFAIV